MTEAAGSPSGPGGFRFDQDGTPSGRDLEPLDLEPLVMALQLGHDQGINGGAVEDHLRHAMGFVQAVGSLPRTPERLVDLGSGGGYPGLVLAYFLPDTEVILVEVREKRADFLRRAVLSLGGDTRAKVVGGDVTDWARSHREGADVVTARSFAPPGVTAECGAPLLRLDGSLLVSEPPTGTTASRWPNEGMATLGLSPATDALFASTRFMIAKKLATTPDRYPRNRRQMDRSPLF